MSNHYFYNLYGIYIQSAIQFPELITQKKDPDVFIYFDEYESLYNLKYNEEKEGLNKICYSVNNVLFLWDNEPIFQVKSGKKIIINPNMKLNEVFLRSLILGQAIGVILHQRGYLVLHASAVNMNGAIAFLGWCGNGKSTTTLALTNLGYPLVVDDVLAIKLNENGIPVVFPSFPRIKLWQDVIKHTINNPDTIPKIHPEINKHSYSIKNNFILDSLPLKMIFILEKSEKNEITSLKPQEALIDLIRHSYCVQIFKDSEQSQNLIQCANIIKNVPVKRLKTCHSLEKLEDLAKLVEEYVLKI